MSVNNDVYQVLVANDDSTPVIDNRGSGSPTTIENLNEQIGIYDDEVFPNRFYFAAKNGEDLTFSPQFNIDPTKIKAMSAMAYRAGQDQISYLSGFNPEVTEGEIELGKILQTYGMKISVENKKIMKLLGIGAYTKSVFSDKVCFDMTQSVFTGKSGTALVEAYQMYKKYAVLLSLYYAINRNEDDYFEAYFVKGTPTAASTPEDLEALVSPATFEGIVNKMATDEIADSNDEYFLVIKSKPLNKAHFSQINMHYYKDRFTSLEISLIEGFCCGAEIVTVQKAASSVGEGYDVMYREYRAGGWNGRPGPYRTYAVTGLAKDEIVYHALQNGQYDLYSITYEIERIAGWLDHRSWVTVEIAVPAAIECDGENLILPDWFTSLQEIAEAAGATVHVDCIDCTNE